MDKDCSTCFHWLGGVYDCCRLNLESECKEGCFEAWEPKHRDKGECDGDACEIRRKKREG